MRQNPHVRICGGPGSATTLAYPTSWAARFRCGSSRVFFVLPQPTHARALDEAMVQMRSTAWIEHRRFELLRRDQLTSTSVQSSMRLDKPPDSPERPSIERCVQSVLTEPLPRRGS